MNREIFIWDDSGNKVLEMVFSDGIFTGARSCEEMGILFDCTKSLFCVRVCHEFDPKPGDVWGRQPQEEWSPSP